VIDRVIQLTLYVRDYDEAKAFYTEKLRFVVRKDVEFQPGWRYLTVAPNEASETAIELAKAGSAEEAALIGRQAAGQKALIMFSSEDIERDHRELTARGVVFHSEPRPVPGGKGAPFEDLYGNKLDLFQLGPG
jgi:lactoylglutathione lyase